MLFDSLEYFKINDINYRLITAEQNRGIRFQMNLANYSFDY